MVSSCLPFALNNGRPVFPLLGNLCQDAAHHAGGGHETVTLVFEDPDLAASHRLAQPLDILYRHARVLAPVLNDHRSSDINIAETNSLATLEADQKIDGWVGIACGKLPDLMSKSSVIVDLSLALCLGRLGARAEGRITSSIRSLGNRRWLRSAQRRGVLGLLMGVLGSVRSPIRSNRFCWFSRRLFFSSLALPSPWRLRKTGSDARAGGAHEAAVGNLEEGRWECTEDSLRVRNGLIRSGFLLRANRR